MNNEEVRKWLDSVWHDVLDEGSTDSDPEIDAFVDSTRVGIRYALVTQMLGKIADPTRSLMSLQLAGGQSGDWNARSFSTAVIVPWVADNQNVLGTSADPYASKPLRRVRLTSEMGDVLNKDQWDDLVDYFTGLEDGTPEDLREAFKRVLRSLARRLARQSFGYAVPQRMNLADLREIVSSFLSVSSGGLRPLAVSTALFKTLADGFSLFSRVESQGVNEADAAGGMPGDIMCYQEDEIRLAVEVKDINLTLAHVRASSLKAKQSSEGLSNLLFAVPGIRDQDEADIRELSDTDWASGLNIYTVQIDSMIETAFVLLEEDWRIRLVREIGDELDLRQDQPARRHWHELLLGVGS